MVCYLLPYFLAVRQKSINKSVNSKASGTAVQYQINIQENTCAAYVTSYVL